MSGIFDSYIVVDWSANSEPKRGKNSIWWCEVRADGNVRNIRNPATRAEAYEEILSVLIRNAEEHQRVLIGFDFPYGYPFGWARLLGFAGKPWSAVWNELVGRIEDQPNNKNNRFEVAAALNRRASGGAFPFWACPESAACATLLSHSPWRQQKSSQLSEFRFVDKRIRGPQSPWKLFTRGSVGSQALLGIPRVSSLLNEPRLRAISRVWPFETGAVAPQTAMGEAIIVHAEIYPSLLRSDSLPGEVKDATQVRSLCSYFCHLDAEDNLVSLFNAPAKLLGDQRRRVEDEEGWILGVAEKADDSYRL